MARSKMQERVWIFVKQKCEKGKEWGTSDSAGENIFKRVARTGVKYKNQGGSAIPSPLNGDQALW